MIFDYIELDKFEKFESSMKVGDRTFVEWKAVQGAAPVKASVSDTLDRKCLTLKTTPGNTWVRLRMVLEDGIAEKLGNAIVGLQFKIRINATANTSGIKPHLVRANLNNFSCQTFESSQPNLLSLKNNIWHLVSGTFATTPLQSKSRLEMVVDIPRSAEILFADMAMETFSPATEDAAVVKPVGSEVWPISQFSATQISNDIQTQPDMAFVYKTSLALNYQTLKGRVLSRADRVYWSESKSNRSGQIPLSPTMSRDESGALGKELSTIFNPPLIPGTIVKLHTSENSEASFWKGSPDEDGLSSVTLFDNFSAHIANYQIFVTGNVTHHCYPGMPVRLSLWQNETIVSTTIARGPATGDKGETAFKFRFSVPLRPNQLNGPFWISFSNFPSVPKLLVNPAPQTMRDMALVPDVAIPDMPEAPTILGNVEGRSNTVIEGWSVCKEEPNCPVELVLYRNGEPVNYCKTRYYRKDLQQIYGSSGFNGFRFEVPSNMSIMQTDELNVVALGASKPLRKANFTTVQPVGFNEAATLPAPRLYTPHAPGMRLQRISIIILNRNGAELLDDMFASCAQDDVTNDIEWIVVDHDSKDTSEKVCQSYVEKGMQVRFFRRKGNYSFSESNNFGVKQCTGDIVLFANNDLIFKHKFGDLIRDYIADPKVGILGTRLVDYIDNAHHKDLHIDQHLGVFFETEITKEGWIRPYEARTGSETNALEQATRCIAVTGAFFAMRRSDFDAVGGFEEQYSYGLEDVDLCLKVQTALNLDVICANNIEIVHHRGFSRSKDTQSGIRRRRNNQIFSSIWGPTLRRMFKDTAFTAPGEMTGRRPTFAFIVADVGDETSAGEFYTSLEMGRALQKLIPCHVRYIPEPDWYDLSGVDIVVSMVNRFDVNKIKKASPWLITVNWMRQWFDRWAEDPSIFGYDYLFASSDRASDYLTEALERPVITMPIASEYHGFANAEPREDWRCDYSFTGSRFGPPREIEFQLDPETIGGEGKIFGYNWEGTDFEGLSQGPVSYSTIPQVYASTRIVLDDGNIATKPWGSCNSRVFDTMASGALLITNSALGTQALFGDLVPTFDDTESLTETVNYWLTHEEERKERTAQMQKVILEDHTYAARAKLFLNELTKPAPIRIAIKCAAIYREREQWGDYHYAQSLAKSLRRLGFVARVDCRESWYGGLCDSDDVTITLRGLIQYKPTLHQKNLLWLISHPNDVSVSEIETFDHAYVASDFHAENLRDIVTCPVDFMPQCTDTTRFFFDEDAVNKNPDCNLYVANSRGIFRDPVRWSIQNELNIDLYGVGWEPFINDARFKGGVVPNSILGGVYASSRLVICDHWEDMRNLGYVANRVFDVLGSGGRLAVDHVRGLAGLVPLEYVDLFASEEEFCSIINGTDNVDINARRETAAWVAKEHSFDARAATFADKINDMMAMDVAHEAAS